MKLKLILGFFLLILMFPQQVSAHLFGQPPFFKVDGQYSNLYPVPTSSFTDFDLPQDLAPVSYLVNKPIHFEFDVSKLPAPPDIVKKSKFYWDFGDGSKGEGLVNDHSYTKQGSFILSVNVDDGTTPEPQLLESVLLDILPSENYKLPKSVIKINGQKSTDPLTDVLKFPFGQTLSFDGSESSGGSSKIISYFWDFGDQKSSTNSVSTHAYAKETPQVFPVLRIKTADGFIADSYLEIEDGQMTNSAAAKTSPVKTQSSESLGNYLKYPGFIIGVIILVGMLKLAFRKKN